MKIKKDIFNITPKVGDIIVYNPPKYKGVVYGKCVGFTKVGLPLCDNTDTIHGLHSWNLVEGKYYAPKTRFVIIQNNNHG